MSPRVRKLSNQRQLPPLTPLRQERLTARVPLQRLSLVSGIPAATLSLAERGVHCLSSDQEQRRREALSQIVRRGLE